MNAKHTKPFLYALSWALFSVGVVATVALFAAEKLVAGVAVGLSTLAATILIPFVLLVQRAAALTTARKNAPKGHAHRLHRRAKVPRLPEVLAARNKVIHSPHFKSGLKEEDLGRYRGHTPGDSD